MGKAKVSCPWPIGALCEEVEISKCAELGFKCVELASKFAEFSSKCVELPSKYAELNSEIGLVIAIA